MWAGDWLGGSTVSRLDMRRNSISMFAESTQILRHQRKLWPSRNRIKAALSIDNRSIFNNRAAKHGEINNILDACE